MHNAPLSTFRNLALPNSGMAAPAALGDRHLAVLLGRQYGNESKRFATSAEDDKYPEMTS
jgi:hypothetical protein